LARLLERIGEIDGISDFTQLYLECRNALNVAKNHQVQSLAASICNQATIDFKKKVEALNLDAKIVLNTHDEITVRCAKEQAQMVADILKECMLDNRVTRLIDVPLGTEPVITDKSLAEAK